VFRRKSPDAVPKLKKSGLLPATIAIVLPLFFLGGSMLQSRTEPPPPPDPQEIFGEEPVVRAGCTFDVDLPALPDREGDASEGWVDCERLLPPLEVTWAPPIRTRSQRIP
jgi:hypothetical protein